jgi:E3 ubiquitin-protein ligase UBR4
MHPFSRASGGDGGGGDDDGALALGTPPKQRATWNTPPATAPKPAPPGTEDTQFSCDVCDVSPIVGHRWHCTRCVDFD